MQDHVTEKKKNHSLELHQKKTFEGAFNMSECVIGEEEQRAAVPVLLLPPLQHAWLCVCVSTTPPLTTQTAELRHKV